MRGEERRALVESSDAELLSRVRSGDPEAYAELWRRHIRAALRVARRLVPARAEDLASESFLAVHHQLTVSGNGPETAFRAYLFTTMRNTAMRWQRADSRIETDPDLDDVEFTDAASILEDRARSAELLEAFRSLPERWQRVLWLTEVEDAARPEIAAELGIRPNAVSALYRRARQGFRLQWLVQQVPPELREDRRHVAGLLPQLVLGDKISTPGRRIAEHLEQCATCAELHTDLVAARRRMGRTTLRAFGFAGLGVVLPAASHLSATAIGAGVAAALLTLGGVTLAAGLGALIITTTLPVQPPWGVPQAEAAPAQTDDRADGARPGDGTGEGDAPVQADEGSPHAPATGRGNADPAIPGPTFSRGSEPNDFYVPPGRPPAAEDGSVPPPAEDATTPLRAGLANPPVESAYLAPVLTGTTAPGASVAIELLSPSNLYTAPPPAQFSVQADADGNWSFDTRAVADTAAGVYEYRVWAFTDTEVSSIDSGSFTLSPLELTGFESVEPFERIPLAEASTTGIVFEARGPAGGTICLASIYSGQAVEIPLDAEGVAVKRIRFLTTGTYLLNFRACEEDHRGPANELFVDVGDPDEVLIGWFGPDPTSTELEVADP